MTRTVGRVFCSLILFVLTATPSWAGIKPGPIPVPVPHPFAFPEPSQYAAGQLEEADRIEVVVSM